jgi:trk system potassium uptake protein TrkH
MKLINPLIILRILSTILLVATLIFLPCIPVAIIYDESPDPFLWSALITVSVYLFLRIATRKVDMKKMNIRDGFLAVTLSWIIFGVVGGLPYIFGRCVPSFIDAFFETVSGFTTTGATIIPDVEILPYSILFWRSLTHWIGGLGIIVLVILILPSLKITAQQLFSLESSLKEKIHPKTKAIGYRLMFAYVGLTVIEVLLLYIGDMTLFDSICHSFGTIATGGFSTRNASLTNYSAYTQYIITIFMFLAGVSFVIYYFVVKLQFSKVKKNEELWFYFGTVITAGIIATCILFFQADKPLELSFREGFFQVVSFITTTGFITTDYLFWPSAGIILLFVLLFAGASTGSSTGSIKMARHFLAVKNIRNSFRKLLHQNVITQVRMNDKLVSEKTSNTIMSFIVLYLFIFLIGTAIMVLTGLDIETAASSAASALGNVGPGLGQIGPMFNYSGLPEFSKFILSLLMITGRLEILTVFALFSRSFWTI